ncbi:MAG: hypothetical protein AB1608_02680 [Thermoproteota archaeon]
MRLGRIIIVSSMVIVFIVVAVFSDRMTTVRESPISDLVELKDSYDINVGSISPDIGPIGNITEQNQTDSKFYYENGKKHYVITAVDEPSIGD